MLGMRNDEIWTRVFGKVPPIGPLSKACFLIPNVIPNTLYELLIQLISIWMYY